MKRLIPFLFAFLILPITMRGQISVSADPSPFTMYGHPSQLDIASHINVLNTSNQTAHLFWSIRMNGNPAGWLTWICDKNLCYTPNITTCPSNKPNILEPGETLDFQVHLNPTNIEGTASYDITILDDQGNVLALIPGQIIINSSATAVKDAQYARLSVFPNPTSDFFQVSEAPGLRYIEVYNIVGNKVRSFDAAPQKQYFVADLNEGIYLVRLIASTGKVIKTVRLSKR